MKKILIITSEPENFVPIELKKSGEKNNVDVIIAKTENFSFTFLDGKCKINYVDRESDLSFDLSEFEYCIPRLNDNNLEFKKNLLIAIEDSGIELMNSAKGMISCQEKILTEKYLNEHKIKTPKTKVLVNIDNLHEDDFNYPIIIKTNTGSQGVGVMKIDSFSSLKSVLQLLFEKQVSILIQEYIKHEASYRIIMLGDQVLASNKRLVPEKDFRSNSHQNGKLINNTEKHQPSENEIKICQNIGKILETNFCAIDYLIDENGEMIVLEVNGSPGLEGIQKNYPEINLSDIIINYIKSFCDEKDKKFQGKNEIEHEAENNIETKPEEKIDFINETESIVIKRFNLEQPIIAKIDTGADSCSVNGKNILIQENEKIVKFEFNNIVYIIPIEKVVNIVKADHEKTKRAVIKMDVIFKNNEYKDIEITIADREKLNFDFLIGKNLLAKCNIPILIKSEEE